MGSPLNLPQPPRPGMAPATPRRPAPAIRTSKAPPAPLTDDESSRLAKEAVEIDKHFLTQLSEPFERAVRAEKMYHNFKRDTRGPDERWRALIRLPWPFETIEAKAAQELEIMTGSEPYIQAGPVGEDDVDKAKEAEALLDYALYGNRWRRLLSKILREKDIKGTAWLTSRWGRKAFTLPVMASADELDRFREAIANAHQIGGLAPPPWQEFPEEFERFRNDWNLTRPNAQIPAPPQAGDHEVVLYEGPLLARVPYFEMRVDPLVDEMEDQETIIRRQVKTDDWVMRMVKNGVFDKARAARAVSEGRNDRLNEYEQRVAEILGYTVTDENNPYLKGSHEVMEVFRPGTEFPYQVVLNGVEVVNPNPREMPYRHGRCPYLPVRNIAIPGYMLGMGDLFQPDHLFHEANKLRELRMDSVVLATLGVFTKLQGVGISDAQRRGLKPGGMLEVTRHDAIKRILGDSSLNLSYQEIDALRAEVQSATGIGPNVSGATAQVGRIPAATEAGRLQQALLRIKLDIIGAEEDLSELPLQLMTLFYEKGGDELRVRANGTGKDTWLTVPKSDILQSLGFDLRFRGATQAIQSEVLVQLMSQFLKDNGALLAPKESRALMARIYEATKMKGVADIVTQQVTNLMQQVWEVTQNMQVQGMQQQQIQQQAAAQGAPATLPLDQAQALQQGQQ